MKPLRRAWNRLVGSLAGGRREAALADEIQAHIDMLTEENLHRGMSPAEARRAAILTFGGVEAVKESYRDQRGLPAFESFRQDVRYALRGMRRNPAFTGVAVACLALGIGANTAIFSLFNAVMLRSLPVSYPAQLVFFGYSQSAGGLSPVRSLTSGLSGASLPYATFEALRDHASNLAGVFMYAPVGGESNNGLTVDVSGQPFTTDGEMVSGSYFAVLGVPSVLGRTIVESDLSPGAPGVIVISHRLWLREFAGERSAIGRSVRVNNSPFTIIGVAPPGFAGLSGNVSDLWLPLRPTPLIRPWGSRSASMDTYFVARWWWWCMIGGRRKPGATRAHVQSEAEYLYRQSITAGVSNVPAHLPALTVSSVSPAFQTLRRRLSTPLGILVVTAALMLLMACVNVAALLVSRAKARQREIGVRLAIGASRARVVRQLLTESILLSSCGGIFGLLLAYWGAPTLLSLIAGYRQTTQLDAGPDGVVLAFAATVSLATGILFGIAPAVHAAREDLAYQLKEATASTTQRGSLARTLVASQICVSVVLIFGAGLFVRTLRNLDGQHLGFDRDNLLLFDIDPERSGYTGQRGMALHNQLAERIGRLPGVQSATYVQEALLSGTHNSTSTTTDVRPLTADRPNEAYYNRVGPGFFDTMGMRVLRGRGIELRDTDGRHPAAVVNESWVRAHFPNENPVGHHLRAGGEAFDPRYAYEIVGVAVDAKYSRMRETPPPTVYLAYGENWGRTRRMCFVVRSSGVAPAALMASVTAAVHSVDPALPLYNARTQRQQVEEAIGTERMLARVSIFFGALALLLVAIGVYGTLSYAVTRRTGEIGIRMALGARRAAVVWMILRESLVVAGLGLAVGLPAALALSRFAKDALFGVDAHDGVTVAATVLILSAIAATSGFLPANRAARIDPIRALRHE
jgi:predicted permease